MHSLLSALKARLRALRYGFLLVPGGCVALSVALAFGLVAIDRSSGQDGLGFGVANDPEAARTVLTVTAGSLITVAGVTFSITMVTLQLVSQQFSPQALRGFLADRITQAVAGAFVGVFVFCLLVLRTVEAAQGGQRPFVPALSVTVAIVLAIGCLLLLLVFIDHIGRNIQVSSIASRTARATLASLNRMYPEPFGDPAGENAEELVRGWHAERRPEQVHADRPGYVQSIVLDDVPENAGSPGLRIEVCVAPGDFVTEEQPLALYWPGREDGDIARALGLAIVVASERDMKQDPGYGLRQLADIATRAISPGINDPTTAWMCIRYIQAVLERLVTRRLPDRVRRYGDTGVVVVAAEQRFADYAEAAYAQIGRYADDPRVAGALLRNLIAVHACAIASGAHDRAELLVRMGRRAAHKVLSGDADEEDRAHIERLLSELSPAPVPTA